MGDAIHQDWESNPHVEILHVLDQINQPYSCNEWGDGGLSGCYSYSNGAWIEETGEDVETQAECKAYDGNTDGIADGYSWINAIPPIIIGGNSVFFNLFQHPGDGSSRPLVVFINHEMEIIFISDNHVTQTDANDLINLMLDNCGDNCDDPLSTININNYLEEFQIQRLYPNPFNPVLNININLTWAGITQVNILDISGSHIETLHSGFLQSGSHEMSWNAESMPSGVYFISLKSGDQNLTEKVVLLK